MTANSEKQKQYQYLCTTPSTLPQLGIADKQWLYSNDNDMQKHEFDREIWMGHICRTVVSRGEWKRNSRFLAPYLRGYINEGYFAYTEMLYFIKI